VVKCGQAGVGGILALIAAAILQMLVPETRPADGQLLLRPSPAD
jgi:hypothetical protein